jgi:hypothetical protein
MWFLTNQAGILKVWVADKNHSGWMILEKVLTVHSDDENESVPWFLIKPFEVYRSKHWDDIIAAATLETLK